MRPRVQLGPGALVPGTRYRIRTWRGDGTTGVVYEAAHTDLERRVALKVLHLEHSQDAEKTRTFREEARTTSQLGSPYIVDVFDFSELPDGRLLYVMELLDGHSLRTEVEETLDPTRLLGVLRQVCKGLAVAHDAGVIHRDIKPENIMVITAPGERPDTIAITDFGTAGFTGVVGVIEGTPSYMAPEQIRNQAMQPPTDVYAVGCMAYELLTGHTPFESDTVKGTLRAHLKEAAPPLPAGDEENGVPQPLAAVIMRCLEKAPEQRYANARELEAALCEAQIEMGLTTPFDDLPVPDVDPERRAKIIAAMPDPAHKRRRSWALPAVLSAALASAATGAVALLTPDTAEERSEVDSIAEQARDAAARARFVYPPVDAPESPTAYSKVQELHALGVDEAEQRATQLSEEFAGTLASLGDRYWEADGGRPFAIDYYVQALLFDPEHARAVERGTVTPGQFAAFKQRAAEVKFSASELASAEPLAALADPDEQARLQRLEEIASAPSSPSIASARVGKLLKKRRASRPSKPMQSDEPKPTTVATAPAKPPTVEAPAEPIPAAPKDAAPEASPKTKRDPAKAREMAKSGRSPLARGDWAEAERIFQRALVLDRRCAAALSGLSDVYFERGKFRKAIDYARKAIAVSPKKGRYRIQLGDALYNVLRYADARAEYERAQKLGSDAAKKRLQRVNAKLGKP